MTAFIDPERDQFRRLVEMPIEGPVHMLNLIRLRARASYEDGRKASGAEAYRAYGEASAEFFQRVGGQIIWRGVPRAGVIGPPAEEWDLGFIAGYPSKAAFLEMVRDEGYQAVVCHRQAAVETSRLYCFEAARGEALFG